MTGLALLATLLLAGEPANEPAGEIETTTSQGNEAASLPRPDMRDADPAEAGPNPSLDVSKRTFGRDSIEKVVASYLPKVQGCYQRTLAKEGAVEGKLAASWVIDAAGLVKGAKIEKEGTTLEDQALHGCVVEVLSSMSFPRPAFGLDQPVSFSFNLKPVGFLAAGPARTVRLTIEPTRPGLRLVDVGRGTTVCEGRCGVLVSADPSKRYLLRVDGPDGWEDSESFTLFRFTRAVIASYGGPNHLMRRFGLGLIIGSGVLLVASALVWVVEFFLFLFTWNLTLASRYAQVAAPVTIATGSVGLAGLVTGLVLRFVRDDRAVNLREDRAASP